MKEMGTLTGAVLPALALAGCDGYESGDAGRAGAAQAAEDATGRYVMVDSAVDDIYTPFVIAKREAAENYLRSVRPKIAGTTRDFPRFVKPNAGVQDQTLLALRVEVESIEQANQALEQGLEAPQLVEAPKGLEPMHESFVEAYERALLAYRNILEPSGAGTRTSSPRLCRRVYSRSRALTPRRAILQEAELVETVTSDD